MGARISEMQVRSICMSLERKTDWSISEIAAHHGVGYYVVRQIYFKVTWVHISDDFDFSGRSDNRYRTGEDRFKRPKTLERVKV